MDPRNAMRDELCIILFALMLAALNGCQSAPWPFGPRHTAESESDEQAVAKTGDDAKTTDAKPTAKEEPTTKPATDNPPIAALTEDRWIQTPRPALPTATDAGPRWRQPAIETLIGTPRARRPSLADSLASDNAVVVANAAIVAARWGTTPPIEKLKSAAQNIELKLPLRLAAADTLGELKSDEAKAAVDDLLKEFGEFNSKDPDTKYVPELHAELLHARAKHMSVASDPRFVAAMKSPSAPVRLEAVAAWARTSTPSLDQTPDGLLDLCTDTDMRVRATALRALAANRHPRAHEYLERGTRDYDVTVRLAAIEALGAVGGDEARHALEKLRKDPSEISRAAVIGALAALGADDAVVAAAGDKSWKVRQAVADSLKALKRDVKDIKHNSEALAHQLVLDTSSEVQRKAVDALREWPLEKAGPALLVAMSEGTYVARKMAAEQLAERWPPAAKYSADAPANRRDEQMAELKQAWEKEHGTLADAIVKVAATEAIVAVGLTPDQVLLLEQLVKQLAEPDLPANVKRQVIKSLQAMGPNLVASLEEWTVEDLKRLPPEIYSQVLPEVSPLFASLEGLTSPDAKVRRTAATQLTSQLNGKRLSDLALNRLEQVAEKETDPLVWQAIFIAINSDPRQIATRLAYVAVANASTEVRRRACEYLQHNADTRHLDVLLPMLDDQNVGVVIAAVRAIGATGQLDDPAPLIKLLATTDLSLRLEIATALAKSKVAEGITAIDRLSQETDLEIRRATAIAMGELCQECFLPSLIVLIDERRDIQLAAMASLAKIAGHDIAHEDEDQSITPDEQVRRWKKWYADREAEKAIAELKQ